MAEVTMDTIKELRALTNAGMMDCKKALIETNGDMEEAIKVLRKKGQAIQVKRADKEAKEGLVATATCPACGAVSLVEVNCETDFVAKTDGFKGFVAKAAEKAAGGEADVAAAMAEDLAALVASTGENMKISRTERYTLQGTGKIEAYIHMGGKIGVLVEVGCTKEETVAKPEFAEFSRDIALQVAALAPRWLDETQIPADIVESEKALYLQQLEADPKNANKPDKIKEGIISGKFRKFAAENCLVDQEFVKISKTSIKQHAANVGKALGDTLTIRRYVRFQLGQH
ncbi:MAG: translation elongation factor Ts [Kiritimatiellae bacterium]|nr:translation elongation factor Ts [Kiritimatiellia bacterium]